MTEGSKAEAEADIMLTDKAAAAAQLTAERMVFLNFIKIIPFLKFIFINLL